MRRPTLIVLVGGTVIRPIHYRGRANLMEGDVCAGSVIELVRRLPQIRIDFLVLGCQARRLKLDDSAKQNFRNHLDRMVCELDGGVVLVRPH